MSCSGTGLIGLFCLYGCKGAVLGSTGCVVVPEPVFAGCVVVSRMGVGTSVEEVAGAAQELQPLVVFVYVVPHDETQDVPQYVVPHGLQEVVQQEFVHTGV